MVCGGLRWFVVFSATLHNVGNGIIFFNDYFSLSVYTLSIRI